MTGDKLDIDQVLIFTAKYIALGLHMRLVVNKFVLAPILIAGLIVVAGYSQPRSRKDESQQTRLYRVSEDDRRSGRRGFGFIDHTGKLIIDFDRRPKKTIEVGDFHDGRAVDVNHCLTHEV